MQAELEARFRAEEELDERDAGRGDDRGGALQHPPGAQRYRQSAVFCLCIKHWQLSHFEVP